MRTDLWNHARVFCLSDFGFKTSKRFRVDGDGFENSRRVDTNIFLRIKKMRFQKRPDICGPGLSLFLSIVT